MPVYEYYCSRCETKFELLRSMDRADAPAPCPSCQSAEVKRVISRFLSFSKGNGGATVPLGPSGCGGCAATSCSSCGK
jgi:putative FmdB family regulatory protein